MMRNRSLNCTHLYSGTELALNTVIRNTQSGGLKPWEMVARREKRKTHGQW